MKRLLLLLSCIWLSGCTTVGYYMDAINGHYELLDKARPINTVINENVSDDLTNKLVSFRQARVFAIEELMLPDNGSYKAYADIGRPYAVWNVIAAAEFSVEPKQWCFLFVGCINYRGYFNKQDAEAYARELQAQGNDVYVAGARAYSTLGWFDDPLLNTMMYNSEAARVGILFHELAHQKIYVEDDSAFNEAFATAVEQEGVKRWFKQRHENEKLKNYKGFIKRKNEFNSLLKKTRKQLQRLYKSKKNKAIKELGKKLIFKQLNNDYLQLKQKWGGYDGYDKWMGQDLNNAHLALIATYNDLVPYFAKQIYDAENMAAFYKKIKSLAEQDINKRKQIIGY